MRHGVEPEVPVGDALQLAIRGVVLDPRLVAAEAVPRVKHRHVPVREARVAVELVTREGAETLRPVVSGATRFDSGAVIPRSLARSRPGVQAQ
jgi:hypothetical protein